MFVQIGSLEPGNAFYTPNKNNPQNPIRNLVDAQTEEGTWTQSSGVGFQPKHTFVCIVANHPDLIKAGEDQNNTKARSELIPA